MAAETSGDRRGDLLAEFRSRVITTGRGSPFVALLSGVILIVLLLALWPVSHVGALGFALALGSVAFVAFRQLRSMGVIAYERGVLVRGFFADRWIPWEDISHFRCPGDLQIVLTDGHVVLAASVTSANYGWLAAKTGESDAVAAELSALRQSHITSLA